MFLLFRLSYLHDCANFLDKGYEEVTDLFHVQWKVPFGVQAVYLSRGKAL